MADEVSVERIIAAAPDVLWARVVDIERMGDISPEAVGGKWLGGATGPAVGARFKGDNRNGKKKWSTTAKVVECDPGKVFAFDVNAGPAKVARWTYRFEPTDAGCKVTETWTDQRGWLGKTFGKPVSGVADRATHNRATMEATLDRLAALSEAAGQRATVDVADVYSTTRSHLLDLARTMDDAQAARPVPALPGWTVKDAYSHLTGLCADLLDGNMEGAGEPEWSARQVAERADRSLAEVAAEWAERGPDLDEWVEEREEPPMFLVYDAWTHEQDILGALGQRGERDDERVQDLAASALAAFSDRFTAEAVPALHVVGDGVECVLGEGEPEATLHIDDYELMRVLFGRRSRRQIEAADWDGDDAVYIPHLHLFPLPAQDLTD